MTNSTTTTSLINDNDENILSQDVILYTIIGILILLICIILAAFLYHRYKHQKNKEFISKFGIQSFKYRKKVPKDVKDAVKNDKTSKPKPKPETQSPSPVELNPKPESPPKSKYAVESKKLEEIINNKMDDMFKTIPQRNRSNTNPQPIQYQHHHTQQEPYLQNHANYANYPNNNNINMSAMHQQQTRNRSTTQQTYMHHNMHRMHQMAAERQRQLQMSMNNNMNVMYPSAVQTDQNIHHEHNKHEHSHSHESSDSHHTHTREYSDHDTVEKDTLHGDTTMREIHHFIKVDIHNELNEEQVIDNDGDIHESSSDSHHTHTKEYSDHDIIEKDTLHGENTMREIDHFIKQDLKNELNNINENEVDVQENDKYQD